MHYLCLVVGADPDKELEPYFGELPVPRYKVFLEADDVKLMASEYSLPETDRAGLAGYMSKWTGEEGGLEEGRLFHWSTDNPDGKYDWYEVGGRFSGYLRLKSPLRPTGWRRLFGARAKEQVNQALKKDVNVDAILSDPPAALLNSGEWHEQPFDSSAEASEEWRRRFSQLFSAIPDDAPLTAMDLHS